MAMNDKRQWRACGGTLDDDDRAKLDDFVDARRGDPMSGDTLTHWLDCPDCSWAVLPSADGLWAEDRAPEHCVGCGALVRVLLDDGAPERAVARAALVERGGVVVARLLAEADYTPPPGKVSDVARASITAAMAAEGSNCIEAGCIPAHTASEVLDAHDDANAEAARLREQLDREVAEVAAGAKDRDKMRRQFAETDARLRQVAKTAERELVAAESPARARAIIAAWAAAGDQMWANQPADTPAAICLDGVDLAAIHGTPTGATPKTSMTGPEYVAAVRESGLTPEDVEGIRGGVRRHRGVDGEPGGES